MYQISLSDTWERLCQENTSIDTLIDLPLGSNVELIQQNLCNAVAQNSTSFQQLVALFNGRDMFIQVSLY